MNNIDISSFNDLKIYFDTILNIDKSTYKSSNDENTPIDCIHRLNQVLNDIPLIDRMKQLSYLNMQSNMRRQDIRRRYMEVLDAN